MIILSIFLLLLLNILICNKLYNLQAQVIEQKDHFNKSADKINKMIADLERESGRAEE